MGFRLPDQAVYSGLGWAQAMRALCTSRPKYLFFFCIKSEEIARGVLKYGKYSEKREIPSF
jgi:hypothetical protein